MKDMIKINAPNNSGNVNGKNSGVINNTIRDGATVQSANLVLRKIRGDGTKKLKIPETIEYMGEVFYTFRGVAKALGFENLSSAKSLLASDKIETAFITDGHDVIAVTTKEEIDKINKEGLHYSPGETVKHMGRTYYPSAAAAKYLKMNRATVSEYMNSGKIPSIWAKSKWIAKECALTTKEELDRFKASLQDKSSEK